MLFSYETGMDVNIQFMWNSNPTCVFFIFRSNVNKNKYIFALSHLGHQDEQTGIKNMPVLCTARVKNACRLFGGKLQHAFSQNQQNVS